MHEGAETAFSNRKSDNLPDFAVPGTSSLLVWLAPLADLVAFLQMGPTRAPLCLFPQLSRLARMLTLPVDTLPSTLYPKASTVKTLTT